MWRARAAGLPAGDAGLPDIQAVGELLAGQAGLMAGIGRQPAEVGHDVHGLC